MDFLRDLIEGSINLSEEQLRRIVDCEDPSLLGGSYTVLVVACAEPISSGAQYLHFCKEMPRYCARHLDKTHVRYRIASVGRGRCVVLLLEPWSQQELSQRLEAFRAALTRHEYVPVHIAVSQQVSALRDVSRAYMAVLSAIQRQPEGLLRNKIIYSQDIVSVYNPSTVQYAFNIDRILTFFQAGNFEYLRRYVTERAEEVRVLSWGGNTQLYPTSIRRMFIEMTVYVLHIASDTGVDVDAELGYIDPYTQLMTLQGTPAIIDWFMNVCQQMYQRIRAIANQKEGSIVETAEAYIQQHLADNDLSLDTVSKAADITPTYLSALFSKEKGIGFSHYVTQARIDAACAMLRDTEEIVSVIAQKTGFSSVNYFTRVFKKATGMTPGRYRSAGAGEP